MGAAEKINKFSGSAKTNWLQTIEKISYLVIPKDNKTKIVTYPLIAAAFILLPKLPQVFFMVCDCGGNTKKKADYKAISTLHAGQTTETIAFTEREYRVGRMTREEKLQLDNQAIQNNSLANLNGIQTKADETPGEWDDYR